MVRLGNRTYQSARPSMVRLGNRTYQSVKAIIDFTIISNSDIKMDRDLDLITTQRT